MMRFVLLLGVVLVIAVGACGSEDDAENLPRAGSDGGGRAGVGGTATGGTATGGAATGGAAAGGANGSAARGGTSGGRPDQPQGGGGGESEAGRGGSSASGGRNGEGGFVAGGESAGGTPTAGSSGMSGSGRPCGARAGDTCGDDEYCAYMPGGLCGAADATALCRTRPDGCTREYNPVCGCDGQTYPNACVAASAGTGVNALGPCDA